MTEPTRPASQQPLPWEQPGWDPHAFLGSLDFDPSIEIEADDLDRATSMEEVPIRRQISLKMSWQVNDRIVAIAREAGSTLEDYLEALVLAEIARADALRASHAPEAGHHHAA